MNESSLRTDERNMPLNDDSPAEAKSSPSPSFPQTSELLSPPADTSTEPEFQPLDPRMISAERIANWIFFAVVAIGGLLGQVVFAALNWPPGAISMAIAIAYVLILIFLVWAGHFYPVLAYRHAAWRLSQQGLEIQRGVWWRHEITIPRARVQHTDVHQGPLMRKFGLARLVINTAGTQNASIPLDGLSFETAHQLRTELVADCNTRMEAEEAP